MDAHSHEQSLAALAEASAKASRQGLAPETLQALVEAASEHGAALALARCGLSDDHAGTDIAELRTLLDAWRDTKLTARRTVVRWLIGALLSALALALAVKLRLIAIGDVFGI